ncbi:hypothetical protein, partial [Erythrobacter donghaensis]|uniref:hypothetical protein n=1 Tax=Erythrobacter donghaensis TaxID=267135 RepID=UPI000A92AC2D
GLLVAHYARPHTEILTVPSMAEGERSNTVSVVITPAGEDKARLSASDFIRQVDALRELIVLSGISQGSTPQITRLEMNSPALVVFEADANSARFNRFFADIAQVAHDGTAPQLLNRGAFDVLKEFSAPVGRGITDARIRCGDFEIIIDIAARKRIESVFGNDDSSEGTIDGMLEAINVHGKKNVFALYPVVGAKRVTCIFEDNLLHKVRPALGKYVEIKGELKYRWREKFPYEAFALDLSILPEWDDQPSFEEILGMAPGAANGMPAEEFTRLQRHGW